MIEFEGRKIPDDDDELTELIREQAHGVVVWEERDERPPSPIDWVSRLCREHPEMTPRVERAYARLLAGADPIEVREILEQTLAHPGDMRGLLVDAVAKHADALRAAHDTTNDRRSLLGAVVEKLDQLAPALTQDAAKALAEIDDAADGWPTTFRLALAADFDSHCKRLVPTLQQLADEGDDALLAFIRGFVAAGSPLTDRGFDEIGAGPTDLRDRVASAVKRFVEDSESARQALLDPKILAKYPPDIQQKLMTSRPDRWPTFAARLGVQP